MSNDLYQQLILEHNKNPRNFGDLPDATHSAEGYNPLCGDRLTLKLRLGEGGILEEVKFQGDGCAISRASASMMTQALKGKPVAEAAAVCEDFLAMLKERSFPPERLRMLGKLQTFSGIWQFPARVKCAALAWHAYRASMNDERQVSTE